MGEAVSPAFPRKPRGAAPPVVPWGCLYYPAFPPAGGREGGGWPYFCTILMAGNARTAAAVGPTPPACQPPLNQPQPRT
jgi:hypothetical protein